MIKTLTSLLEARLCNATYFLSLLESKCEDDIMCSWRPPSYSTLDTSLKKIEKHFSIFYDWWSTWQAGSQERVCRPPSPLVAPVHAPTPVKVGLKCHLETWVRCVINVDAGEAHHSGKIWTLFDKCCFWTLSLLNTDDFFTVCKGGGLTCTFPVVIFNWTIFYRFTHYLVNFCRNRHFCTF